MNLKKLVLVTTLLLTGAFQMNSSSANASETINLTIGESIMLPDGARVKCVAPELVTCKLIVSAYSSFSGQGYSVDAAKSDAIKQCNNYLTSHPFKVDGRLINPCDPSQTPSYISIFSGCRK